MAGKITMQELSSDLTKEIVTLTNTQTLINKTIESPKINQILDTAYGLVHTVFTGVASAVNYFIFNNSATNNNLEINAAGTDTNININLVPKGSGTLQYNGSEIAKKSLSVQKSGDTMTGALIADVDVGPISLKNLPTSMPAMGLKFIKNASFTRLMDLKASIPSHVSKQPCM